VGRRTAIDGTQGHHTKFSKPSEYLRETDVMVFEFFNFVCLVLMKIVSIVRRLSNRLTVL
jgi:hypothetical protein